MGFLVLSLFFLCIKGGVGFFVISSDGVMLIVDENFGFVVFWCLFVRLFGFFYCNFFWDCCLVCDVVIDVCCYGWVVWLYVLFWLR